MADLEDLDALLEDAISRIPSSKRPSPLPTPLTNEDGFFTVSFAQWALNARFVRHIARITVIECSCGARIERLDAILAEYRHQRGGPARWVRLSTLPAQFIAPLRMTATYRVECCLACVPAADWSEVEADATFSQPV